jgi:hypothetical protein
MLSLIDQLIRQNNIAPILGLSGDANDPKSIRIDFAIEATPEQMAACRAFVDAIDPESLKLPDIPAFFDGLVKAIIAGQLPGDVHAKALMVKDLKAPADQAAALGAFSSDPVYTKEQKQLLDALIKSTNLQLPDVPGAE